MLVATKIVESSPKLLKEAKECFKMFQVNVIDVDGNIVKHMCREIKNYSIYSGVSDLTLVLVTGDKNFEVISDILRIQMDESCLLVKTVNYTFIIVRKRD